jgi:hypothetical protein
MEQQRIVTLEQLKAEIREYGITRLAREIGCSRQHMQRIVGGQRKPGKRLLAAMQYQLVIRYLDIMPSKDQQTPSQAT